MYDGSRRPTVTYLTGMPLAFNIISTRTRPDALLRPYCATARRPVATSALFRRRLAIVSSELATVESGQDGGCIVRDQTAASRCGF